jgi:putative transposase
MTNYRRSRIVGASYFFTVNLAHRSQTLLIDHVASLRQTFAQVRERHPFTIDAIVILPDHVHAIWTLPSGDSDFALRWRLIKAGFSRTLPRIENRTASRQSKQERGVWQRRYWEHLIRDDVDFARHADYIHFNPVKHGWVTRVADWPHSSFHRYVRQGILPSDWGGGADAGDQQYGERR